MPSTMRLRSVGLPNGNRRTSSFCPLTTGRTSPRCDIWRSAGSLASDSLTRAHTVAVREAASEPQFRWLRRRVHPCGSSCSCLGGDSLLDYCFPLCVERRHRASLPYSVGLCIVRDARLG